MFEDEEDENEDYKTNCYQIDFKIDNADMAQYKDLFVGVNKETSFTTFAPQFPVLENITLNNMTLPADLDFSSYHKLKSINLSATTTTSVTFPESGRLEQIVLPATLTKFKIYNNPGLKSVRFEGYDNIQEVYIDCSKCGQFNVEQFLVKLTSCLGLNSVTIRNANNDDVTSSFNVTKNNTLVIPAPTTASSSTTRISSAPGVA